MLPFCKGQYRARLAGSPEDIRAAQRLRYKAFRAGRSVGDDDGIDSDALDERCLHLMIETEAKGVLVGTCRLLLIRGMADLRQSYAAQFYDLHPPPVWRDPMLEIGRFCLAPDVHDSDALRLAWAALTRIVEAEGVGRMFGCSSFAGVDSALYSDALALLALRHLGEPRERPARKAVETIPLLPEPHDARRAMAQMPPLLRSYLAMGGWVSDHAVVDRDLGTLHVFTAVDIAAIPPARARLLRADAS